MNLVKLQNYSIKKLIIILTGLVLLVILTKCISADINSKYKNDYASRMEINLKNKYIKGDNLIKGSDIDALRSQFPSGSVSYMQECDEMLEVGTSINSIKTVLSGEELDSYLGLNIIRGAFFNNMQYNSAANVAVISESLAQRLFLTNHVIGNELTMLGNKYKIIGVYKNKNSILSTFSSDGSERVYIPYYSSPFAGEGAVNTVFIKDSSLKDTAFRVNKVEKLLQQKLKVDSAQYKILDYYDIAVYVTQPLYMFVFFIGVLLIIILIRYFISFLKVGYLFYKNKIKGQYFLEMLRNNRLSISLFLTVSVLAVMFIARMFYAIRFRGIIPYELIPADNVFDLTFYAGKAKEAIICFNNSVGYAPTQLELIMRNDLIIIFILIVLLIITFASMTSAIKLYKEVSESTAKYIIAVLASLAAGTVLSLVLCTICGISFDFPQREMIIIGLYLLMKGINKDELMSGLNSFLNNL